MKPDCTAHADGLQPLEQDIPRLAEQRASDLQADIIGNAFRETIRRELERKANPTQEQPVIDV